jgi:hypothetical protein
MASLFVGLDDVQMETLQQNGTVQRAWFGEPGSCSMIPAKRSAAAASTSFLTAVGQSPQYILHFTMPLLVFYEMVDSRVMVPCLHVDGYRLYTDIVLDEAAGWEWLLHPVTAIGESSLD